VGWLGAVRQWLEQRTGPGCAAPGSEGRDRVRDERPDLPRAEIIAAYLAGTSLSALAQRYARRASPRPPTRQLGRGPSGRAAANRLAHSRTRPAPPADHAPAPGDRDGHGRWAQLDVSEDGESLLCHECGQWKRALGTHAWYRHGITAAQYRRRHGFSSGQSLASPASQGRFAAMPQAQEGSTGRRALETHRDPDRAAMTNEGRHRAQLSATRARTCARTRRGRPLTPDEVAALTAAADLDTGAHTAQRLVEDGVRQAEISRVTGTPTPTVSQRLRRRR